MITNAANFRQQLASGTMVVAPGCYDGLTARLIEGAGFGCAYMTGAGTSAAHGYPDFGLITMSEMVANARRITATIGIPLISDADTGYGNELNVYRTIQEFEAAGVAGVHIEDQGFPKKCGHLDDKEIIPLDEYLPKIRAAAAARKSKDFAIIARTDSRARLGFEEAVRRGNAALSAGADIVFVEAPQTMDEVKAIPKQVKGPCLLNVVQGGKTPAIDMAAAQAAGYAVSILPGLLTRAVMAACDGVLRDVKATGRAPGMDEGGAKGGANVRAFFNRLGAEEWDARRTAYRPEGRKAAE